MPQQQLCCPDCGHDEFTWTIEALARGQLSRVDNDDTVIDEEHVQSVTQDYTHVGITCDRCGEFWQRPELEVDSSQDTLADSNPGP